MRYLIMAYLIFVILFDFYGGTTRQWNIAYFSMQYLFAFGVSVYFLFNATWGRIHFVIPAAIFGSLVINELCMLRFCDADYFYKISDNAPYLSWGITFVLLTTFLIILKKLIK